MSTIEYDEDIWRVLGVGANRDGQTLLHLASTTRGRQQKNGWYPIQICSWIDNDLIETVVNQRNSK